MFLHCVDDNYYSNYKNPSLNLYYPTKYPLNLLLYNNIAMHSYFDYYLVELHFYNYNYASSCSHYHYTSKDKLLAMELLRRLVSAPLEAFRSLS